MYLDKIVNLSHDAFKNKIAVITGGGRGIGKAIASQYSKQGATVVIAEFDENSGKNTAEKIGGHFFKTDISDENGVSSLFDYVKTNFSCLDILVNNAGVLDDSTLRKLNLTSLIMSSMLICVAPIYAERQQQI